MHYESSAGGVVINRKEKEIFVLLLQDQKGEWTFPKGLIEKGEDKVSCAAREINEEVGLQGVKFLTELSPITYFYKREGNLIKKSVYYFVFTGDATQKLTPQAEEGIMDVQWFPYAKALEIIGYKKTNTPILEEAKKKLRSLVI